MSRPFPRFLLRFAGWLHVILFGLTVFVLGFSWLGTATDRWYLQPVLSDSMSPHIRTGDAVVLTRRPAVDMTPGQIIAIHNPPGHEGTFVHRVTAVDNRSGTMAVTTKGDANNRIDDWSPISVKGTTVLGPAAVIPKLGWVLKAFATTLGRNAGAALLGITIVRLLVPRVDAERQQRKRRPSTPPREFDRPLIALPAGPQPRPSLGELLTPIPWADPGQRALPRRTSRV